MAEVNSFSCCSHLKGKIYLEFCVCFHFLIQTSNKPIRIEFTLECRNWYCYTFVKFVCNKNEIPFLIWCKMNKIAALKWIPFTINRNWYVWNVYVVVQISFQMRWQQKKKEKRKYIIFHWIVRTKIVELKFPFGEQFCIEFIVQCSVCVCVFQDKKKRRRRNEQTIFYIYFLTIAIHSHVVAYSWHHVLYLLFLSEYFFFLSYISIYMYKKKNFLFPNIHILIMYFDAKFKTWKQWATA